MNRRFIALSAIAVASFVVTTATGNGSTLIRLLTSAAAPTLYVSEYDHSDAIILRGSHESIIQGPRTKLNEPISIAREPSGDLVLVDPTIRRQKIPGSIVTVPPRAGDPKAKYVISCSSSAFFGVTVDASSNIWATEDNKTAIEVYASNADGCAKPLFSIRGKKTGLIAPTGIAIDSQGRIIVENWYPNSGVEVFAPGSKGNVAPIAVITGSATGIDHPEGLTVDAHDNIWVTNYGALSNPARIMEFPPNANGNVAPERVIHGPNTQLQATVGIAIGQKTGKIYVTNGGTSSSQLGGVLVFARNASGDAAPLEELVPHTFPTGVVVNE